MGQTIREVMTPDPVMLPADAPLDKAAECMRDLGIGDVLVVDSDGNGRGGKLCGVVTDRDIVVRAIAEHRDPTSTRLADVCSRDLLTLGPDDTVDEAVRLMSDRAVRRLPIVENGRAIGMVSIGDLALERDPTSALAGISAAPPNA